MIHRTFRHSAVSDHEHLLLRKNADPRKGPASSPEVPSAPEQIAGKESLDPIDRKLEEQTEKIDAATEAAEDRATATTETIDRTAEQLAQMKIDAEMWENMTQEQKQEAVTTFEKQTPATQLTIKEKAKQTMQDIRKDFTEGGPWTKAGYIAGGVVGFLAARWLWRKAFGDGKNEGFVKKSGKWLLSLGAGVAGVLGVKALIDRFNVKNKDIQDAVDTTIESGKAAAGGIAGSAKEISTLAAPVIATATEAVNTAVGIKRTVQEFLNGGDAASAIKEAMSHGWGVLRNGTEFFCVLGKEHIRIPVELQEKAQAYLDGKENMYNLAMVYTEAGIVYATDTVILSAVLGNYSHPTLAGTAAKVLGWPGYMVKDGVSYSIFLLKDRRVITTKLNSWPRYLKYRSAMSTAKSAEMADITHAVRQWCAFDDTHTFMQGHRKEWQRAGFSDTDVGKITKYKRNIAEKLQRTMKAMKEVPADAPEWLKNLHADSRLNTLDKFMDSLKANVPQEMTQEAVKKAPTAILQATNKTAEAIEKHPQISKAIQGLMQQIKNLRESKNYKQILKMLNNPVFKQAAAYGDKSAIAMMRVGRFLASQKWAGKALIIAGPIIDTALLGLNEMEIAEAKENGNLGMQQTLESRRITLLGTGAAGIGILALSGPQIVIALPAYIVSSIYTDKIYEGVINWEKSRNDWLKQSPEKLKNRLKELSVGYVNTAHRAAYGDTVFQYAWKRLPFVGKSNKELEKEGGEQFDAIESVNANERQEVLAAYFIKTMQVRRFPNESDDDFINRTTQDVRDRMNFMHSLTDGTYAISNFGPAMFEAAENYAELAAMRRQLQQKNASLVQNYEFNGKEKSIDLGTLSYVIEKKSNDEAAQMSMFKALVQYRDEIKPQREAVMDYLQFAQAEEQTH